MSDISYVSLIFVDDVYSNWVCKPGQGGIGKQLSNDIQNVNCYQGFQRVVNPKLLPRVPKDHQ